MADHHPIPASMTPPASADGEKPSPLDNAHHQHQHPHIHANQHQHPQLTSPQLSDLDLDSTAVPDAAETGITPVEEDIEPDHYYGGGGIPVFKPVSFMSGLELGHRVVLVLGELWLIVVKCGV